MITNKIIKFSNLNKLRKKNKKSKIILAHGTFDLFHYGHLKHLEKSKKKADILVVSLTADKYVKKGSDRPIYNENQRASIISNFEFVDYVTIVKSDSGVEVINLLKPDFYSKGIEYKKFNNDPTQKILMEEKILKKNNGKLFFTNEDVLSSSNIINKIKLEKKSPRSDFLKKMRKKVKLNFFLNNFDKIYKKKVLVIGDAILDKYIFTSALAKSPKEELISVKENYEKIYLGGILATSMHISSFVKKPTMLTILGKDSKINQIIKRKLKKNCNLKLFIDKTRNNIVKTRYLDITKKKLFQSNNLPLEDITHELEKKVCQYLTKKINKFDIVIVNDFGHGFLTKKIRKILENKSKILCVNVQTNSANLGYNYFYKYSKCNYLTMDEPEARLATEERFGKTSLITKKIFKKTKSNIVSITYGSNGTQIFKKNEKSFVPALSSNAIDTLGAGDAFFAISSIYQLIDKKLENIAFIGNVAGAIKIKHLGHEKYVKKDIFFEYLKSILS